MFLENILPVLVAFFIVTVSPGPANIAAATISMSKGRKHGSKFALGLSTGLAFWGLVAATGMGAILQASEVALIALKVFGGLYLLWLAYQSATAAAKPTQFDQSSSGNGNWYLRGFLLNASNPKAVVAWMAALSMGLGNGDSIVVLAMVTIVCMILGVVNYIGHAVLFSNPNVMNGYIRFRRWIEGAVAVLFALAGFSLLRSAIAR